MNSHESNNSSLADSITSEMVETGAVKTSITSGKRKTITKRTLTNLPPKGKVKSTPWGVVLKPVPRKSVVEEIASAGDDIKTSNNVKINTLVNGEKTQKIAFKKMVSFMCSYFNHRHASNEIRTIFENHIFIKKGSKKCLARRISFDKIKYFYTSHFFIFLNHCVL